MSINRKKLFAYIKKNNILICNKTNKHMLRKMREYNILKNIIKKLEKRIK